MTPSADEASLHSLGRSPKTKKGNKAFPLNFESFDGRQKFGGRKAKVWTTMHASGWGEWDEIQSGGDKTMLLARRISLNPVASFRWVEEGTKFPPGSESDFILPLGN